MATKHFIMHAREMDRRHINDPPWNEEKKNGFISEAMLEKEAHKKLTGGFDRRLKNLCARCHTFKSKNGACLCD